MAASLRHPLSGLVWLAMAVIYLPILPAGAMLLAPAFSLTNWQRLLNDPQLPQAAVATLVSTLIATLGRCSLPFSSSAFSGPVNAGDVSQPACRGCWRSPCSVRHRRATAVCRGRTVLSGLHRLFAAV